MPAKKLFPARKYATHHVSCPVCGEFYPIAAAYLLIMQKAGAVICGFCKSPGVVEISEQDWDDYLDAQRKKHMAERPSAKLIGIEKVDEFTYMVPSGTTPGKFYRAQVLPGDVWTCECTGYELSCISRGTDCRHIKKVKELGLSRPSSETCVPRSPI